jgi:hypothetical protein
VAVTDVFGQQAAALDTGRDQHAPPVLPALLLSCSLARTRTLHPGRDRPVGQQMQPAQHASRIWGRLYWTIVSVCGCTDHFARTALQHCTQQRRQLAGVLCM